MGAPIPWRDEVKRTSKLTIALDPSIGQHGWAKPFQDGVAAFNALAAQVRLGVTYELTNDQANANVVAQAKTTTFKFGYDDGEFKKEEEEYKFDGTSLHGHCSMLSGEVRNRTTRSYELRMIRAFIFVPAKPRADPRQARDRGRPGQDGRGGARDGSRLRARQWPPHGRRRVLLAEGEVRSEEPG